MSIEEERKEGIEKAFHQSSQEHRLPAINTLSFYTRKFLPEESFLLKRQFLNELLKSRFIVPEEGRWAIKK